MKLTTFPPFLGDEKAVASVINTKMPFIAVYPWQEKDLVVLGRSSHEIPDVNIEACNKHGIGIVRRKCGGGVVLLTEGIWIITAAYPLPANNIVDIPQVLDDIVLVIGKVLEQFYGKEFSLQGMGDLTINDKKIIGSSLYHGKGLVMYQGSLLVQAELKKISRYLGKQSKEPAYRMGRKHDEFITNLGLPAETDFLPVAEKLAKVLLEFTPR
ncbi:MAG: hypothetical protein WCI30_05005 [Clostridia bacterium]